MKTLGAEDLIPADPGDRISNLEDTSARKWQFDDKFARQVLVELCGKCWVGNDSVPELEKPVAWDLYAVYVNGLHEALRERGLGVRVYGRLVPLLLYAICGRHCAACS